MLSAAPPANEQHINAIRRFNRFYTRQIGLLDEGMLDSPFSLTQVRTLYELAQAKQTTAAELCQDLGLDAGYLSRILAAFQKEGLVEKKESTKDARQTLLSLTRKGHKAFEPLNHRSSEQVGAMLGKLLRGRQNELLHAMGTIESLLSPKDERVAPYIFRPHQPGDMGWIVHRHGVLYWQEYHYDERFEAMVAEIVADFIAKFDPVRERCWIVEKDRENVGSICLVKKSTTIAQLRLLLVEPSVRGLGIGKRLVAECIRFAQQAGYGKIMLWTQSELAAARRLYQDAGFKLVAEKKHQGWSRTDLVSETWELKL